MNKIITAGCVAVAAFAAVAMPNKRELADARRIVEDVTKADLAAFKAGKKPAKDVARAHISLAEKVENQAEKYLLYQGAFKLYARCEEYDRAADAIEAMKRGVKDVPPEVIAEIVGDELRYVPDNRAPQLVAMLKEAKGAVTVAKVPSKATKDRSTIQSIIDGMIKVPGRDYWLSETELTQGQWEAVMGYNLSAHKGVNLPVENVSRDDCDVFLEKLNQTKDAQNSQFEFSLPNHVDWAYAACDGWKKPGLVENILDTAWLKENSANQTHEVATKSPNPFGFYDMVGNVSEWVSNVPADVHCKSSAYFQSVGESSPHRYWCNMPRSCRTEYYGVRLMARIRANKALNAEPRLGGRHQARRQEEKKVEQQATVNGMTWTYEVVNGEIVLGGKKWEAIIPTDTTGKLVIPDTIDGKPVRGIGFRAFCGCSRLTSVTIPTSVTSIGHDAFKGCDGLKTVVIPASVTNIHPAAFCACVALESFSVDWENPAYSSRNGLLCSKDGTRLVSGVNGNVVIPASVKNIEGASFFDFKGLKSVTIPNGVTSIGAMAFNGCEGLKDVTIPASVTHIEDYAFAGCAERTSVTMLGEKPDCGKDIFGSADGSPKLTAIHVPANARSWAGMKEWQGKPLVFDAK